MIYNGVLLISMIVTLLKRIHAFLSIWMKIRNSTQRTKELQFGKLYTMKIVSVHSQLPILSKKIRTYVLKKPCFTKWLVVCTRLSAPTFLWTTTLLYKMLSMMKTICILLKMLRILMTVLDPIPTVLKIFILSMLLLWKQWLWWSQFSVSRSILAVFKSMKRQTKLHLIKLMSY